MLIKQEKGLLSFDGKFSRTGRILEIGATFSDFQYPITDLSPQILDQTYKIVRQVEDNIAPVFDDQQFASPGMQFLAETDSKLMQRWLGDIRGERLLEIGPGTGRFTLPMVEAVGNKGKVYAIDISPAFIETLAKKAAIAQISQDRLSLAVGDIQNIPMEAFDRFLASKPVDAITIWFSVLSLMTTNPQTVIDICTGRLNPGGSLLVNTNSFDGVAFRIPEAAARQGADPALPLGYSPSIYSSRSFLPGEITTPNGMVLGNGDIMPAAFYRPEDLIQLMANSGLVVEEVQGVTRLAGLYPRDVNNTSLIQYAQIISNIEPQASREMFEKIDDSEEVLQIAKRFDSRFAGNKSRLPQYNYIAIKAKKE